MRSADGGLANELRHGYRFAVRVRIFTGERLEGEEVSFDDSDLIAQCQLRRRRAYLIDAVHLISG